MTKAKKTLLISIVVIFLIIAVKFTTFKIKEYEDKAVRPVENFSEFTINTFPVGWRSRGGNGEEVYSVKSEGEKYLEAIANSSAVTIAKKFEYDLLEYPILSWQWRVIELPQGGDERYKRTGDSGAGIYVIFPGLLFPESIKYVWSSSLPLSSTTESPYNGDTKVMVLRNHTSPLGTWLSEKVNVYEDYKKLFGHEPEEVIAIGLMSDSDNTKSRAVAHYKKLEVSKKNILEKVLCNLDIC